MENSADHRPRMISLGHPRTSAPISPASPTARTPGAWPRCSAPNAFPSADRDILAQLLGALPAPRFKSLGTLGAVSLYEMARALHATGNRRKRLRPLDPQIRAAAEQSARARNLDR